MAEKVAVVTCCRPYPGQVSCPVLILAVASRVSRRVLPKRATEDLSERRNSLLLSYSLYCFHRGKVPGKEKPNVYAGGGHVRSRSWIICHLVCVVLMCVL